MKIALTGSKGHGKDYLADLLIQHKPNYIKIAFADALKDYCNELYPQLKKYNTPELKDSPINEPWNIYNETPRNIWERISREKSIEDPLFFHKITLHEIDKLIKTNHKDIIITDVRNKVEVDDLIKRNFTIIKIIKPNTPMFLGYDERIKEFWDDIELIYTNNNDGLDFINQLDILELMKKDN
jgi:hypothetical protein